MHTTTNFLLANLALADLLTLLWCIPGILLKDLITHPNGLLTLTLVSVERYNALVNPLNASLRLTKENVKYPIVAMWMFAFIFVLPLFIFEDWDEMQNRCIMLWKKPSATIYWSILTLVVFLAFVLVCFCYLNIIRGLYFTKLLRKFKVLFSRGDASQA